MSENKENQRIRLTKKLLKDALVDLLITTPLRHITITEICARAEINRTTFYKYYASEYDLYADIENDFFAILRENIENTDMESLEKLLTLIQTHRKIAAALISNSSEENFSQRIFSLPELTRNLNFQKIEKSENKEEIFLFIFSGAYAVIKRWFNMGFDRTPKGMSELLINMIDKMFNNNIAFTSNKQS